tara:strand:+ start:193 stop:1365 length:1173 start_codon:yes stop_codon:yes gene_type:complete
MNIPENFKQTIHDFTRDLNTTFPEYTNYTSKWQNMDDHTCEELYKHCSTFYPPHFFDILYQNEDLYIEKNLFFIPELDFALLFNCEDVSENTKQTIWKYLQLILFMVAGNIKDKSMFGDTANIFEGIEEDKLEEKLKDTMGDIQGFFSKMNIDLSNVGLDISDNLFEDMGEEPDISGDTPFTMPNMENIHNHLKSLFDGKIGKFAKELAEELTEEFSSLGGEQSNTSDLLKQMMKNPKKIMDLVKTIGEKIKQKMETGEISKEEMMGEASEILNKMKEMGGQKEFNKMFKNFAGGMGKNSKINMSALQSMAKQEATRERMRSKIQKKKEYTINESDPNNLVFKINEEEKQERSTVAPSQTDEELISMFDDVKVEPVAKPKKSKKGKKTKK